MNQYLWKWKQSPTALVYTYITRAEKGSVLWIKNMNEMCRIVIFVYNLSSTDANKRKTQTFRIRTKQSGLLPERMP